MAQTGNKTTEAAKPAPAAPTATEQAPTRTRTTAPLMDYSSLDAGDTGASISTVTSNPFKALEGTPFEKWVTESNEAGKAKYVDVPPSTVKQVVHLLQLAARKAGLGVRIPEKRETVNGKVRVVFQGKSRAKHDPNKLRRPSKPRKGEPRETFAARVAAWEAQSGQKWEPKK